MARRADDVERRLPQAKQVKDQHHRNAGPVEAAGGSAVDHKHARIGNKLLVGGEIATIGRVNKRDKQVKADDQRDAHIGPKNGR